MKNEVKERLKEFVKLKGMTIQGLEKAMGRSNAYINNLKSIPPDVIKAVLDIYPELNVNWLITGIGMPENTNQVKAEKTIPLVNMFAIGGTLTDQLDGLSTNSLERVMAPVNGAEMAIEVSGDSMAPKYPSGTRLFCKRVDDPAFIEWGKVYVLDTSHGAVVKELRPGSTNDSVMCHSLNDNRKYVPFEVPLSSARSIWKVLAGLVLE